MEIKEIQQAIADKTPVLVMQSYKFSDTPTVILSFCGNPDYVNVEGSDDAYEVWRLRLEKPLEQMVHEITEGVSVIVGEHSPNCEAVGWVKEKMSPFEWNVMQPNLVQCNDKGQLVKDFEYVGNISVWYQFDCACMKCKCKKRIKASAIAVM